MITLECEYCGSEYYAERLSSKYCCDSHKTLASRLRKHNEEIEHERQLQQAELDEIMSRIEENRKRLEKQATAELAERMRVAIEEQKKYKEQQTIKDEMRRQREKDRRTAENKKRAEKADLDFKLTGLGIISGIGLLNLFIKSIATQVTKPWKQEEKQPNLSNPNIVPDIKDSNEKPVSENPTENPDKGIL